VTNIFQSFTYKMAAKINWHIDIEQNYATVTLCITVIMYVQRKMYVCMYAVSDDRNAVIKNILDAVVVLLGLSPIL